MLNEKYPKGLESKEGYYSGTPCQGIGGDKANHQCHRTRQIRSKHKIGVQDGTILRMFN